MSMSPSASIAAIPAVAQENCSDDVTIRRASTDTRVRAGSDATYLAPPAVPGRHVLLTGCRSDQTSKEVPIRAGSAAP